MRNKFAWEEKFDKTVLKILFISNCSYKIAASFPNSNGNEFLFTLQICNSKKTPEAHFTAFFPPEDASTHTLIATGFARFFIDWLL